jgi:hypothetical protein
MQVGYLEDTRYIIEYEVASKSRYYGVKLSYKESCTEPVSCEDPVLYTWTIYASVLYDSTQKVPDYKKLMPGDVKIEGDVAVCELIQVTTACEGTDTVSASDGTYRSIHLNLRKGIDMYLVNRLKNYAGIKY